MGTLPLVTQLGPVRLLPYFRCATFSPKKRAPAPPNFRSLSQKLFTGCVNIQKTACMAASAKKAASVSQKGVPESRVRKVNIASAMTPANSAMPPSVKPG